MWIWIFVAILLIALGIVSYRYSKARGGVSDETARRVNEEESQRLRNLNREHGTGGGGGGTVI